MDEQVPDGAIRSEDGYYWWDDANQAWQPVPQDAGTPPARSGTITAEPNAVQELTFAHDEVVAMVAQGGAELPGHDGGQAYA